MVRYQPTSVTMPSTICPLEGRNSTSSPTCISREGQSAGTHDSAGNNKQRKTVGACRKCCAGHTSGAARGTRRGTAAAPQQRRTSKGLEERMMRPVNRFSRISRPARPTARPPTPPMASTAGAQAEGSRLLSRGRGAWGRQTQAPRMGLSCRSEVGSTSRPDVQTRHKCPPILGQLAALQSCQPDGGTAAAAACTPAFPTRVHIEAQRLHPKHCRHHQRQHAHQLVHRLQPALPRDVPLQLQLPGRLADDAAAGRRGREGGVKGGRGAGRHPLAARPHELVCPHITVRGRQDWLCRRVATLPVGQWHMCSPALDVEHHARGGDDKGERQRRAYHLIKGGQAAGRGGEAVAGWLARSGQAPAAACADCPCCSVPLAMHDGAPTQSAAWR